MFSLNLQHNSSALHVFISQANFKHFGQWFGAPKKGHKEMKNTHLEHELRQNAVKKQHSGNTMVGFRTSLKRQTV